MKKSAYRQNEDEVKILIGEAKVRNNLTDEGLAKKMGMPLPTLRNRKCNPGRFRLDDNRMIELLAGRALTYAQQQWHAHECYLERINIGGL